MKKYGFGVDIGGTTCKLGLFDLTGTLLERWEINTDKSEKGAHIVKQVAAAVLGKMQERDISNDEVAGIGLDVPGPVAKDGTVIQCVNIGWENYNAAAELEKYSNFPVKIGNDANVAALGEMWQGGGKGYKDVVMVTLGTGVGGGVIIDGKMIAGTNGIGGEIGHMTMNAGETLQCCCGKYGCLEQYASATGIVRMTKQLLNEQTAPSSLRECQSTEKGLTAKDIFDAAKEKDTIAVQAVEQLGKVLGTALANISLLVNPEIFVIGGGVSKAGEILPDTVKKYFCQETLPAGRATKFALATLGNDAGMVGCIQMLLEETDNI